MKQKAWYILWILLFLGGSTASLLYVQGFRFEFDSQELISTGVLEISSAPPGAIILINGELQGTTPKTLRGLPLGPVRLRLEKSGYRSFDEEIVIQKDLVTYLRDFFLTPEDPEQILEIWGDENSILWDPKKRGYVRIFFEEKYLLFYNLVTGEERSMELSTTPSGLFLDDEGMLHGVPNKNGENLPFPLFSRNFSPPLESANAAAMISPNGKELLHVQGNTLRLKNFETKVSKTVLRTDEEIQGAWWLPESDDIVGVSMSEIFFWNSTTGRKRIFLKRADISNPIFLPEQMRLIYKNKEIWESVNFGLEKPFRQSLLFGWKK